MRHRRRHGHRRGVVREAGSERHPAGRDVLVLRGRQLRRRWRCCWRDQVDRGHGGCAGSEGHGGVAQQRPPRLRQWGRRPERGQLDRAHEELWDEAQCLLLQHCHPRLRGEGRPRNRCRVVPQPQRREARAQRAVLRGGRAGLHPLGGHAGRHRVVQPDAHQWHPRHREHLLHSHPELRQGRRRRRGGHVDGADALLGDRARLPLLHLRHRRVGQERRHKAGRAVVRAHGCNRRRGRHCGRQRGAEGLQLPPRHRGSAGVVRLHEPQRLSAQRGVLRVGHQDRCRDRRCSRRVGLGGEDVAQGAGPEPLALRQGRPEPRQGAEPRGRHPVG
mmetsp:Transcript_103989/g.233465  ORF Transcript_103989/g.233465 Transcript_103989/m.233465 type:complete len:331 (+) Transcript_103989:654-1646(+)